MKKKVCRALLCLLAAVLVFSGAGCGGKDSSTEITIFKWDFAGLNSARRQNTPIYQKMKEVTGGYDLKAYTSSYSDWEGVVNNYFNTQTLPDVLINYAVDRPTAFTKWIKDGAVLPISDYVGPDKHPNVYNELQKYQFLLDRLDYLNGKWYFLPIHIEMTHGMFVRNDWVDNLNAKLGKILVAEGVISEASQLTDALRTQYEFKLPDTLTEFYRLSKAFTIYDPDNNGRDDTYGYTCGGGLMWYNNWIFKAFGGSYWGMVEDGEGGLTSSWITEENKQALGFINKLYKEGIMDPDYTAMSDPTKIDNFCKGKTGIMVDNIYYNNYLEQLRVAGGMTMDEAKHALAVIAPPKGENGDYGLKGNPGFWCGTSLNGRISAEKREAVLSMLDFMLGDEGKELFTYGVEGVHYKVEDGEKVSLMGQDTQGYNYTILSKDAAFDLIQLVDFTYMYNPGFSSNYEYVQGLLDRAREYSYNDPVVYVQTPLYVRYEQQLGNDSLESYVGMIAADFGGYNTGAIGTVNWDNIVTRGAAFDSAFSDFQNKFLNTWSGKAMITEYSAVAKNYLK